MQSSPHLWVRASCPLPSFSTCEFSRFGTKRTKANALISICLFLSLLQFYFIGILFFVSFTGAKLVFFLLFFKKTGFIFVFFPLLCSALLLPDGCLLLLWRLWILSVELLLSGKNFWLWRGCQN